MAKAVRTVLSDKAVRSALFAFTLTRVVILLIFILATNIEFVDPAKPKGEIKVQEVAINLRGAHIARRLRPLASQGDGGWYMGIAREGYERKPFDTASEHNWVYFPLYPFLLRLASLFTGGEDLTGMALSTLLLLPALVLVHKAVGAFGYDEGVAERAVFYIAAYPSSYFFSLPMTESLYLLLTVASFYAAAKERWHMAGALGALASATRAPGVLLLPALLILYWERHGFRPQRSVLWLLLVPAGLVSFMLFLQQATGNALAFKDAQVAWGRHTTFFLVPLYNYLSREAFVISQPWNFVSLDFMAAAAALISGLILLKWRRWSLGLYTLASVILPLSTYNLQSLSRYVMVLFPVFIVLAVAGGRSTRVDQTIRAVFMVLLALTAALYGAHFSFTFP